MVMELSDLSVDKTKVGKEPDLGCHTGGKVIDVTEKELDQVLCPEGLQAPQGRHHSTCLPTQPSYSIG